MEKAGTKEIATSQRTKTVIYPYHYDIKGKSRTIPPPSEKFSKRYIEYRRQWEENPKEGIVSDFPLHLSIEATGRCNLMCRHCIRYSRRDGIGDMAFDLFKKIIDEGKKYNLPSINPSLMGESFLHPKIIDMIKYAKSNNVLGIRINTNGTFGIKESADKKMFEKVLDSGLDIIIFSIDAVNEKTYNRIKFGSDFKLVNKNIEYLINLRDEKGLYAPEIIVQMIDQKQTHEELTGFTRYWQNKADIIRHAIYQSPDGRPSDKNRVQNTPDEIFPCSQLWQRLVIAWNGTVYPCVGDNACRMPLGNVEHDDIYGIWHGEKMNYLRKKHMRYEADDLDICSHCDLNKVPKDVISYRKKNFAM